MLQVAATGTWLAYNTWGGSNALSGHHRPGPRPVCPHGLDAAAMVPRLRRAAAGCAARAAGNRRCRRRPRRAIRIWNGPTPPAIPRNTPRRAGRAMTAISSAGPSAPAMRSTSPASTNCISTPEILDGYDCVVFVGHDEYWTWEMRDAVDAYVERGGHAARFAGNFMWQTRLEDEGRRQVCYKYRARAEDPAYRERRRDPRHQFLGSAGNRPAGRADLRAQCHQGRLCRLGRLRAARRARLSGLPAGALGLCRHRHLLRRPARRRQPCLRLRGRRAGP